MVEEEKNKKFWKKYNFLILSSIFVAGAVILGASNFQSEEKSFVSEDRSALERKTYSSRRVTSGSDSSDSYKSPSTDYSDYSDYEDDGYILGRI